MPYAPFVIGELNDGKEAQFPGSDIDPLSQLCQVLVCQELTDRMDQVPALGHWLRMQGQAGSEAADMGIAVHGGLIKVLAVLWVPMVPGRLALLLRIEYFGTKISILNFHRPTKKHADKWPAFDAAMLALSRQEILNGSHPLFVGDTNEAAPLDLANFLRMTWEAPFSTSVVGLFVPRQIKVTGVDRLPKTGEHSPVVAYLKVPIGVLP